jgi:hypothetical protein
MIRSTYKNSNGVPLLWFGYDSSGPNYFGMTRLPSVNHAVSILRRGNWGTFVDIHARRWLDYDFVALAVLITSISVLELIVFGL